MSDKRRNEYHDIERKSEGESFRKAYGRNDPRFSFRQLLLMLVAAILIGLAIRALI